MHPVLVNYTDKEGVEYTFMWSSPPPELVQELTDNIGIGFPQDLDYTFVSVAVSATTMENTVVRSMITSVTCDELQDLHALTLKRFFNE